MRFHILLTHYHLDHVEGLPFFHPLYDPANTITLYGFDSEDRSVQEILGTLMGPPYFPIQFSKVPATVNFVRLDGAPLSFEDLKVSCLKLNHPQGCYAYRLERGNRRIVYATDHEHGNEAMDSDLVRFSDKADYLIYDAQYVPSEYESSHRGWGHSTWYEGVRIARAAGVKTLCLFHHHPMHTDGQVDALVAEARKDLPNVEVEAAYEGLELPI
jgi:phosphoribosyl 1,2-cyclic phosphodiesterase